MVWRRRQLDISLPTNLREEREKEKSSQGAKVRSQKNGTQYISHTVPFPGCWYDHDIPFSA